MPELKADRVIVDQAEARHNISIMRIVVAKQIIAENGKVTTVLYKQIVIAMGEGAKTSLAAFYYLLMNPVSEYDVLQKTKNRDVAIIRQGSCNIFFVFQLDVRTTGLPERSTLRQGLRPSIDRVLTV